MSKESRLIVLAVQILIGGHPEWMLGIYTFQHARSIMEQAQVKLAEIIATATLACTALVSCLYGYVKVKQSGEISRP
ncbi:hypothetical protein P175DRAFT_0532413 [Aspergillus ochraceoroseus IBT 24754]|uniref:Uncharacterized protein n=1 Tax=Aspergillus ochraceoroseus IBT 24754 TaxID=1392256 RepID=A0A2T5LXS2_9EURO|nr:uncharacterized protein P175DRAFT_0532413 [Aspergillus ochraceoroseus IBT 24754]PTU21043.1 hypothetical protein P175DRAFT_0532413 [Aspergillus ochraceoroseus IBT 24754]